MAAAPGSPGAPRDPPSAPFDAAAATYDAAFSDSRLGRRLRTEAWRWLDRAFGPGDRVLELGCGTGADAVHLASRGVTVVATDASTRMLDEARARMIVRDANDLVTLQPLDATTIGVPGWADASDRRFEGPFDGVVADFGVLNCIPDRVRLLGGLGDVVKPGGRVVLVAMGPLCPWEIGWHLLHGEPRAAVRRWRTGGRAAVGDRAVIRVWYPSAAQVALEADPWFGVVRVGGIGIALPPSGLSAAMEHRPWMMRVAAPMDRFLGDTPLGAAFADHWAMELRRRSG